MSVQVRDVSDFAKNVDMVANGWVQRINRPADYTIYAEDGAVMFKDIRNGQEPKEIGKVRG